MTTSITRLTKTIVDRAPARENLYQLRDASLPGFVCRVHPSGKKTFCVRYRMRAGRGERRYAIGTYGEALTVIQARRIAKDVLARVNRGEDPSRQRKQAMTAPTVAQTAERFMREHVRVHLKPSTQDTYALLLRKHLLPALGSTKIAEVTRADAERLHRQIGATKQGTANRVLALLSVLCTRAEVWELRPQNSNPCRFVKRFKENAKERCLEPAERRRLRAALEWSSTRRPGQPGYVSPGALAAIQLLERTGARLSEITGLTWMMVDWRTECIRLPDSKTGAVILPVSSHTMKLLRELHERRMPGCEFVCPSRTGRKLRNMQRAWQVVRRRAGLEDVRLHDLRHSAASDAIMSGVPLEIVSKMLGHRCGQTTRRYVHIANDAIRAGVERAGEAIESAAAESNVVELRRTGEKK